MITIEQEEKVRELIKVGRWSDNKIAEKTGVSRHAVEWVKKTLKSMAGISEADKASVKEMLITGFPLQAIEVRARVSREKIVAIRRYYYLCKRKLGWRGGKCPTCGSIIGEKLRMRNVGYAAKPFLSEDQSVAMQKIIFDVYELGKLEIIKNPLFFNIAKQAEKLLENINDKG